MVALSSMRRYSQRYKRKNINLPFGSDVEDRGTDYFLALFVLVCFADPVRTFGNSPMEKGVPDRLWAVRWTFRLQITGQMTLTLASKHHRLSAILPTSYYFYFETMSFLLLNCLLTARTWIYPHFSLFRISWLYLKTNERPPMRSCYYCCPRVQVQ